jgi:predicted amidohydrolase
MYGPKSQLDIVLFPEMSFTGYNFVNHEDALPYSVAQNEGIDFEFAKQEALRLKSYVAFGYIERSI